MKYQLIIFDWDGTLVDSTGRIVASMQAAASEVGLPVVTDQEVRNIIGLGLPEAIKTLWPSIEDSQLRDLSQLYAQQFVSDSDVAMAPYPGMRAMIDELASQRQLAVATGKSRRGLDRMLTDLGMHDVFAKTRCADETRSKPDPLMLHEILSELSLDAKEALMVGDTTYDLDMANRIGMDCVGMSYGAHSVERLQTSNPLAICDSIEQLSAWIRSR